MDPSTRETEKFVYNVKSSAASGCVSNSHFGRSFQKENFKIYENLSVDLVKPFEKKDSTVIVEADVDDEGSETNGHEKYLLFSKGGLHLILLS